MTNEKFVDSLANFGQQTKDPPTCKIQVGPRIAKASSALICCDLLCSAMRSSHPTWAPFPTPPTETDKTGAKLARRPEQVLSPDASISHSDARSRSTTDN